jgi:hypothetical protein
MIYKDYYGQSQEFFGERAISAVYKGLVLVWTAIRSCFGKGYWINDKPWVNTDAWKNS